MIYFDFETRGVVDLRRVGATRYAIDPATQVLCACWSFDKDDDVFLWHRDHPWIAKSPRPDELIDRIASGEPLEAHNAEFELDIWNETLRREFPEFNVPITLEQLRCSAAKASCLSLPRALGEACKALDLPEKKLEDGQRLINKLSKPGRKGVWCEDQVEHEKNWIYCGQDVRAERGLSEWCDEHGGMPEREMDYWRMTVRMNRRGFALDQSAVEAGLDLCAQETARLNAEMQDITLGAVEGGSKRKAFLGWSRAELMQLTGDSEVFAEIRMPNTRADTLSFALHGVPTKAGEETKAAQKPVMDAKWASWGDEGAPLKRAFEIALEVNRTSVSKYKAMAKSVCPDGRVHDILLYNGADRTGRFSGKGVQPHNFVRGYTKEMSDVWEDLKTLDLDYVTMVWGDPLPALAKACRGALVASRGCELYTADFNAIEARKLAWLSGCAPLLELFRDPPKNSDVYCAMASGIYGREITKADKIERQLGKKAILGLGYAMGWEKFQATVWMEEGIWLDDEFCQMIVRVYRKELYPEIPALWKASERAAIAAVQEGGEHYAGGNEFGEGAISYFVSGPFLHCRLPSGRLLAYLYPEVHNRITYRFAATNRHDKPCIVSFPARIGVPAHRARWHAEKLAEKQQKTLRPEPPETFTSPHLSFMGRDIFTKKWKRCGTHGGSLVENFDQASSADLLKEAMWRLDQDDRFDLLLSIHDENIAEAPSGTCELKEFEGMMAETPFWCPTMPITAEGWIGPRLRK